MAVATGGHRWADLEKGAARRAETWRWVSRSRVRGLTVEASGPAVSVRWDPPREGTVVRDVREGRQVEWAVPGWHDEWLAPNTATEIFRWLGAVPVDGVTLADKIGRVREVQARLMGRDPRIVQATVVYQERIEETHITTEQFDRHAEVCRVLLAGVAIVHDQGRSDQDRALCGRVGGFEVAQLSEEALEQAVAGSLRLLSAGTIPPGVYRVVTHPEVTGVLAHEAFGHGVEMDLFLSGRARARDMRGRRVGSSLATIIDDPGIPGGFANYPFDDDGTLARAHTILDAGILVGGLSDDDVRRALAADGGNGRRQDYSRKVYPRMSNTFFRPGTSTVGDLIAGVEHGVYLRQVESGMEDPKNWGLQITCHTGEEIRDGRLTGRLYRTLAMTGDVPQVLLSIDGAANDFAMSPGLCGKGWKEWVSNGTGGPHLRMTARLG